ncbi:hypothetical protein [Arthrobacter sp. NA-172]|uniref:hypothetical protein n=1 Tax=Arthrobacter sp. NA-172 TaxID=3367524 RepID=UPI0037553A41
MLEKVEINDEAARALLRSPEVKADLKRRGNRIAAAAGAGTWDVTESNTPSRARVSVGTGDYKAREAEATNRTLLRALEAGRG